MTAMLAWFALMGLPSLALTVGGIWVNWDADEKWERLAGRVMVAVGVALIAFTLVVGLGFTSTTTGSAY